MPGTITAIVDWQDTWSNGCKCHVPEGKRVYVIDAVTWQVCLIDRHAWVSLPGELLLGVNTAPPPAQDGFWPDLTLFLLPGPGPDVWFWGDETGWSGTSTMVFPTKTALRLFKAYPATSDCQKEPTALHGFLFHNVTDPKTGKQMFATPMVAGAPEIVLPL